MSPPGSGACLLYWLSNKWNWKPRVSFSLFAELLPVVFQVKASVVAENEEEVQSKSHLLAVQLPANSFTALKVIPYPIKE